MNFKREKRTFKNEINPGSMADIGFLLLIFFLVSTTISVDKGILVNLPPLDTLTDPTPLPSKNLCSILVNKDNQLLVRGEEMKSDKLTEYLKDFITNPSKNPAFPSSPNKAVISIQNDRGTQYETYITIYNEIRKTYNQLREEKAQTLFNKSFHMCNASQQLSIRQMIPMIISEADPVDLQ